MEREETNIHRHWQNESTHLENFVRKDEGRKGKGQDQDTRIRGEKSHCLFFDPPLFI